MDSIPSVGKHSARQGVLCRRQCRCRNIRCRIRLDDKPACHRYQPIPRNGSHARHAEQTDDTPQLERLLQLRSQLPFLTLKQSRSKKTIKTTTLNIQPQIGAAFHLKPPLNPSSSSPTHPHHPSPSPSPSPHYPTPTPFIPITPHPSPPHYAPPLLYQTFLPTFVSTIQTQPNENDI